MSKNLDVPEKNGGSKNFKIGAQFSVLGRMTLEPKELPHQTCPRGLADAHDRGFLKNFLTMTIQKLAQHSTYERQ